MFVDCCLFCGAYVDYSCVLTGCLLIVELYVDGLFVDRWLFFVVVDLFVGCWLLLFLCVVCCSLFAAS